MVDFAAAKARLKATVNAPMPPSESARVKHMIEYHLGDMTEWEVSFCYSQKQWLMANNRLGAKTASKLKELEDMYCGQICHALQKSGIPHSKGE